ncbi:amidohydrolase family protein [uncultured Roseobacter sp.]|uniref:amidohydrolase family protein n=1 Tax=uncultured Roseobacter sp. TaxID=114847 RepID=UPI002626B93A|nr:amidohydrolase family protein [uncultured Roseobacter sp.]
MSNFIIINIEHGLTGRLGDHARFSGALRVRDGVIHEMGNLQPEAGETVVDAKHSVVCPGFVNTHHHLFQSVMKAVPEALNQPLDPWLMEAPYRFWPYLNEEGMRTTVTIGLAELALSGVTTVADHHYIYSDRYDYNPSDVLCETAARFGQRFVLGRGGLTHGRPWHRDDIPPAPATSLEHMLDGLSSDVVRWHDPSPTAMTRIAAAPVTTIFNLREGEVKEVAQAARHLGIRLHTHLSENDTYVNTTLDRYGKRPVPWMAEQEWIGDDVWFAHLVKIDEREIDMLSEAGTAMAHCPQANARLASGIAPVPRFAERGGVVSLAVDGTAANEAGDMAQTLYAAFILHRTGGQADATTAENVIHWATSGGARALGLSGIGTLEPGKAADLLVLGLDHPRYFGQHDRTVGPIISGGELRLRHSFVAGREIVRDGAVPWLDMDELNEKSLQTVDILKRGAQRAH